MKRNIAFFLGLFLILMACGGDDPDPTPTTCDTTDMTYTDDISTIINGSCAIAGCHLDGMELPFLHDYESIKAEIDGPNRIVGSINMDEGFVPMPRISAGASETAEFEQCNIDKIEAWIADGAPE